MPQQQFTEFFEFDLATVITIHACKHTIQLTLVERVTDLSQMVLNFIDHQGSVTIPIHQIKQAAQLGFAVVRGGIKVLAYYAAPALPLASGDESSK
jgi:hypothetical protein